MLASIERRDVRFCRQIHGFRRKSGAIDRNPIHPMKELSFVPVCSLLLCGVGGPAAVPPRNSFGTYGFTAEPAGAALDPSFGL